MIFDSFYNIDKDTPLILIAFNSDSNPKTVFKAYDVTGENNIITKLTELTTVYGIENCDYIIGRPYFGRKSIKDFDSECNEYAEYQRLKAKFEDR